MLKSASSIISASQIATPITLPGDVTLSTGNLVIGTSGKGIDFSATSHHAGMTSELLNDYEEGTWTPTLKEGANTLTIGTAYGRYTKIGRLVTLSLNLENITQSGTTGELTITGQPFSAEITGTNGGFIGVTRYNRFTVPANCFTLVLDTIGNVIYLYWTQTGDVNSLQVVANDIANASTSDLYATIQYIV